MPQEPMHDEGLSVQKATPAGLDLHLREQMLEIRWSDGLTSRYPLAYLRKNCPCAACRTDREKRAKTLLPIMTASPGGELTVVGGQMVGNYALQLRWSDGHESGIFDFKYLRALHAGLPLT